MNSLIFQNLHEYFLFLKNKNQNFEKLTKRYDLQICFCNKIVYHTEQFSRWLNQQFGGRSFEFFFQNRYFQKCKKIIKKSKYTQKN